MFADLNAAILTTFAEPTVYKSSAGDVPMGGVFVENLLQDAIGAADFSDATYALQITQEFATANDVALRQQVERGGITYTIIDMQADLSGLVTLTLRRYV